MRTSIKMHHLQLSSEIGRAFRTLPSPMTATEAGQRPDWTTSGAVAAVAGLRSRWRMNQNTQAEDPGCPVRILDSHPVEAS